MAIKATCVCVVLMIFVGVAQGVITGIRGLCNGLGPAIFGLIFFLFDVDLNDHPVPETAASGSISMMLAASNITGRMSYLNTIWPYNGVRGRLFESIVLSSVQCFNTVGWVRRKTAGPCIHKNSLPIQVK